MLPQKLKFAYFGNVIFLPKTEIILNQGTAKEIPLDHLRKYLFLKSVFLEVLTDCLQSPNGILRIEYQGVHGKFLPTCTLKRKKADSLKTHKTSSEPDCYQKSERTIYSRNRHKQRRHNDVFLSFKKCTQSLR